MSGFQLLHFAQLMEAGKCAEALVILQGHPEITTLLPDPSITVLQTCVSPGALGSPDVPSIVAELLRLKCDPNEVGKVSKDPVLYMCAGAATPVQRAEVLCDLLLGAKADPNLSSPHSIPIGGMTPVMRATLALRPTIVKRLLRAGADPAARLGVCTPLDFLFVKLQQTHAIKNTLGSPLLASLSPELREMTRTLASATPPLPSAPVLSKCCRSLIKKHLAAGARFPSSPVLHGLKTPLQLLAEVDPSLPEWTRKLVCTVCGRRGRFWCSRCDFAHYCGTECQKRHWLGGHRKECVSHGKETTEGAQGRASEGGTAQPAQPAQPETEGNGEDSAGGKDSAGGGGGGEEK